MKNKYLRRSDPISDYVLEEQVGHLLRRANQRHTALFGRMFAPFGLTALQFAALMKLRERGAMSQNHLGRLTAMDPNTTQGVIQRLCARELVKRERNPDDRRQVVLVLTEAGAELANTLVSQGFEISAQTLEPLSAEEQRQFVDLLRRLI